MAKRQKKSFFQFKKFTVHQDRTAMKVCTDACVLGAISEFTDPTYLLDIGTGTGLLSLMVAQRYPESKIKSIELEPEAANQAKENAKRSPFAHQIEVENTSFQSFIENKENQFTGVICNPPFYVNDLQSTNHKKNVAHHQTTLRFEELAFGIQKILKPGGVSWILLPPVEMEKLSSIFAERFFFKTRSITLSHQVDMPVIREISCFERREKEVPFQTEAISIFHRDGTYTSRFVEALKEYYLIF